MLNHVLDRAAVRKKIAVATCCDDFTSFLEKLLASWGFEVCERDCREVLLLAEEGCAEPLERQQAVWLTHSKYQGTDRISLPLEIESLWQVLEHRYHRPPRMHIRMVVDVEATVDVDGKTEVARLSSLSDMGCRFSYCRELVREQKVVITMAFAGKKFRIDSRVIYSHHLSAAADDQTRVGLLFHGINREQRELLRSCLILQYLQGVEKEMTAARFRSALEKLRLNNFVRRRLEADASIS